tara:strand:- start:1729 stop:1899 length:171 start_codon:yes stop_codon:yes gene_type:complete
MNELKKILTKKKDELSSKTEFYHPDNCDEVSANAYAYMIGQIDLINEIIKEIKDHE